MVIANSIWKKAGEFFEIAGFCFKISWKASNRYFLVRLALEIVIAVVPFASILLIRELINFFAVLPAIKADAPDSIHKLIWLLSLLLVINIVKRLVDRVKEYCGKMHRDLIGREVEIQIAGQSAGLDLSYFDSSKFYNEMINVRRDANAMQTLTWFVTDLIRLGIQFVISFAVLITLNAVFALVLFAAGIPSAIYEKKLTGVIYRWQKKHVPEERKMNYIINLLTEREFAKDVRLFGIQKEILSRYGSMWNDWFNNKRDTTFKNSRKVMLLSILPGIGAIGISLFVGAEIIYGRLTVGDFSLYWGIIDQFMNGLFMIIILISQIYDNKLRLVNYNNFMQWKSNIKDTGNMKPVPPLEIRFVDVAFKYPGTGQYILKNINFSISQNEKIALVGLNGAGKSTVVKLILRYYDPSEGRILVNGVDIKEYDLKEYRKRFSVLFQDYANYAFTIRENITLSDMDKKADIEKINDAVERSGTRSVADRYDAGLDTYLSRRFEESGEELSGGEWQKIALARTFFREGDIIILDEPSAALDPEAEHRVFEKFAELCEGKGAIFISHRLSNVAMADRIIVLENGEVIEDGPHRKLMEQKGKYAYLFKLQAEKYMAG